MIALLEKQMEALRQVDEGKSADLPTWLIFPLWDKGLIESVPVANAKYKYVVNKTGKLVLAAANRGEL